MENVGLRMTEKGKKDKPTLGDNFLFLRVKCIGTRIRI